MNNQSITGHIVEQETLLNGTAKTGDYAFAQTGDGLFLFCLLPGDSNMHGLPLEKGKVHDRPCWNWDGDKQNPSMTPSILAYGPDGKAFWHGYLRNGRFESC